LLDVSTGDGKIVLYGPKDESCGIRYLASAPAVLSYNVLRVFNLIAYSLAFQRELTRFPLRYATLN
jgi:hypothetical protein